MTTSNGLTQDFLPADPSNTFFIDSPRICCSAKISAAGTNTTVQANWIYVSGGMAKEPNSVLRSDTAACDRDCHIGFTMPAPPGGFAYGEYKVELTAGGGKPVAFNFSIMRDESVPLPAISSFSASSVSITLGQSVTLKWAASNAARISIQPSPGSVAAQGTAEVVPACDTDYTIYAVNRGGSSSNSISIRVLPPITARADLVVTDLWQTGNVLFYNLKNIGNMTSCPSESHLHKNGILQSKDYAGPLEPGQERVESFSSYHFSPRFLSLTVATPPEGTTDAINIQICANATNACPETNDANNCAEHNYGPLLNLHLEHYARNAQWQCNTGPLAWPMFHDNRSGWGQVAWAQVKNSGAHPDTILMQPPQPGSGWIEARVGLPKDSPPGGLRPFTIPHKCRLTATVGLTPEVPNSASVKFTLGVVEGSNITYFPPVTIDPKNKPSAYEVDLSKLADKQAMFIFRVECSVPLLQGSAVWIDPTLVQDW